MTIPWPHSGRSKRFDVQATDLYASLLNQLTAKTTPVAADKAAIVDSQDSNKNKNVLLSAIFGALNAIVYAKDDDPHSIFILGPVEQNFGSSTSAVATKLTDSAPCKLRVLAMIASITQAKAGGSVDDQTKLAKEAAGTTAMTGVLTCDMSDTVYSNSVGNCVMVMGASGADGVVAAGDDIYIYTAAAASRSAGKYQAMAICQKTA